MWQGVQAITDHKARTLGLQGRPLPSKFSACPQYIELTYGKLLNLTTYLSRWPETEQISLYMLWQTSLTSPLPERLSLWALRWPLSTLFQSNNLCLSSMTTFLPASLNMICFEWVVSDHIKLTEWCKDNNLSLSVGFRRTCHCTSTEQLWRAWCVHNRGLLLSSQQYPPSQESSAAFCRGWRGFSHGYSKIRSHGYSKSFLQQSIPKNPPVHITYRVSSASNLT